MVLGFRRKSTLPIPYYLEGCYMILRRGRFGPQTVGMSLGSFLWARSMPSCSFLTTTGISRCLHLSDKVDTATASGGFIFYLSAYWDGSWSWVLDSRVHFTYTLLSGRVLYDFMPSRLTTAMRHRARKWHIYFFYAFARVTPERTNIDALSFGGDNNTPANITFLCPFLGQCWYGGRCWCREKLL